MDEAWEKHLDRGDYCETCDDHNENCPYYDKDEESWDYEQCYKETDWVGE